LLATLQFKGLKMEAPEYLVCVCDNRLWEYKEEFRCSKCGFPLADSDVLDLLYGHTDLSQLYCIIRGIPYDQ